MSDGYLLFWSLHRFGPAFYIMNMLYGYLRFWSVHGFGPMPDVLCRVEHSEGQASQEISGAEESGHRTQGKARAIWRWKIILELKSV